MSYIEWHRPNHLPYPHVWSRFIAKDIDSEELVEYRIQDLPPHLYDEGIEHMVKHFLKDEPMSKSRNFLSDMVSLGELRENWKHVIQGHKLTVACFKEGSDEIIGMNVLYICGKDEPRTNLSDKFKGENFKINLDTYFYIVDQIDLFSHYKVDKYLSAFGLSVNAKYSGRGIGNRLLDTRKFICKSFGIELTSSMFTSNIAQKCAAKAGFETNVSITYEDLEKANPKFAFPNITSTQATIASIKY